VQSRYRIDRLLGEGGMARVYAATDLRLGRTVALKFGLAERGPGDLWLAHLEREARAASSLTHPNIAAIYDFEYDEDGRPFIVMELVEGENLSERLGGGRLATEEALRIAGNVASALSEAHRHGILHRDIKPSNIRLNERNETKVLDFGLARWVEGAEKEGSTSPETLTRGVRGTPAYMSPEQAQGLTLSPATDVFSLGTLLYECLTGVQPFRADSFAGTLARLVQDSPEPPSSMAGALPDGVDALTLRMLAKDPRERPAAREVVEEIRGILEPGDGGLDRTWAASWWKWWRLAAACVTLACAAVAAAWWLRVGRSEPPQPQQALRWFEDGMRGIRDGCYLKASKAFEEAVRTSPGFAMARARLAEAWFELDDVQRARREMLTAFPPGKWTPRMSRTHALTIAGIHRTIAGERGAAVAEFRTLTTVARGADLAQAWFDLGRAEERAGNRAGAMEAHRKALKADGLMAGAYLRLGRLYVNSQEAAKAEPELNRAEELYTAASNQEGVAEVYYQRARLARLRDPVQAQGWLEKVIDKARATNNQQQLVAAGLMQVTLLLTKGEVEQGRRKAEETVQLAKETGAAVLLSRALVDVGDALRLSRQYAEAERYYRDSLSKAEENSDERSAARASFGLGVLAHNRDDFEEAVRRVELALDYYRKQDARREIGQTLLQLARIRRDAGQFAQAEKDFQDLLDQFSSSADHLILGYAMDGLATVNFHKEKYRRAMELFEKACEHYSAAKSEVLFTQRQRGRAAACLGHFDEAARASDSALKTAETTRPGQLAGVMEERAEMFLMMGQPGRARTELSRAISLKGNVSPVIKIDVWAAAGAGGEARRECDTQTGAEFVNKPARDRGRLLLSCGAAAVLAGEADRGAEMASKAAEIFANLGIPLSAWKARAWVSVARRGDAGARQAEASAWKQAEEYMGAEDFSLWTKRSDVAGLRARLR
jgi:tetratricopeptide (TPR) repeat protein